MRRLVSIDECGDQLRARIYRAEGRAELLASTVGASHEIARAVFLAFLGELPAGETTTQKRRRTKRKDGES